MQVNVKRIKDVPLPEYQTEGAAGFDLAIFENVQVWPGERVLARTGLVIETPADHMLMIVPRSSTFKKWKVQLGNSVGIVDSDFCGDQDELLLALWRPLDNEMGYVSTIPAGTRLAQGIIVPVIQVEFQEVDKMAAVTRGGYGSTGN